MKNETVRYSQKSVLIIEDFTEFARSVRAMMNTMGAKQIDLVYKGEDAIERCRDRKYDIILSDYNLGNKKDGQQVLEELHKFQLLKSTAVFIMITAENTAAMVMGALEFQPDSYLTKPFNSKVLKSRLDRAIIKNDTLAPILRKMKNKKWSEALQESKQILADNPKYRMACLRLKFNCYKKMKKYQQALELTTEIVGERPLPWAVLGLGEIYYIKKEYQRALDVFQDMTKQFPMVPDGYDWLSKVQRKMGQTIDAQSTLAKAVERSPKALARQISLGQLAEENDDLETMTKAFRQAVKFGKNSAFSSPNEYISLTKSLGRQIRENANADKNKLIEEAEVVFNSLDSRFKGSSCTKLRSAVAHAEFCDIVEDKEKVDKYLDVAHKTYENFDEHLGVNESIEVSQSLKDLGDQELVESILTEAIEQNIDDARFLKKAAQLTTNSDLINRSQKASELNNKAIKLFNSNDFENAISYFSKADEVVPNNVNIKLNHVQALLKSYQKQESLPLLENAEKLLSGTSKLAINDPRYKRYSELSRLTQLLRQRVAID